MQIHQISPSIAYGDAISNHIYEMDIRFRKWGYDSHIFVQQAKGYQPVGARVQSHDELEKVLHHRDDLFIYHYGIYHSSVDLFQKARGHKILIYHNITPAHFFTGWDLHSEKICNIGRAYLQCLTDCEFAIGDSDFNRQELVDAGFDATKTAVLPIFLTLETFAALPIDEQLIQSLQQDNKVNWLTIGRIAPNKAIEEVIRTFYVYHTHLNPNSHLHLIGASHIPAYQEALTALITELGLTEHITFAGKVSNAQLKTYYTYADLYFTASRHEGFCVPLIESMHFNLPILANNSTAIPETLGDSGILFTHLGYEEVATMAHLITSDPHLKQKILAAQQKRLDAFAPNQVETILRNLIKPFV